MTFSRARMALATSLVAVVCSPVAAQALDAPTDLSTEPEVVASASTSDPNGDVARAYGWDDASARIQRLPDIERLDASLDTSTGRLDATFAMADVIKRARTHTQWVALKGFVGDSAFRATVYDAHRAPRFVVDGVSTCTGRGADDKPRVRFDFDRGENTVEVSFPIACLPDGQTVSDLGGFAKTKYFTEYVGSDRLDAPIEYLTVR